MRDTFNVLDEGWIPVLNGSGGRETLGIRELLRRAPELLAVSDASPLVEFGLYRLLTVFLMDALRPKKLSSLKKLLRAGAFDMEAIEAYIAECEAEGVSFDLLDEKRPFLQAPYDERWDKEPVPVSKLDYAIPSGNNHTHFDHRSGNAVTFSYGEAARLLPAAYVFCPPGGSGYSPGINGLPPYYTLIHGSNLIETLILNLCVTERIDRFDDHPVFWRNEWYAETEIALPSTSFLFGMLFPSRRIHLITKDGFISALYYGPGMKVENSASWTDYSVTYRVTEKGRFALLPTHEKAVWRNLQEIINLRGGAARILSQYFELLRESTNANITMYGAETVKASFKAILRHDLRVPMVVAGDNDRLDTLKSAISAAENAAYGLRLSLAGTEKNPGVLTADGASDAVRAFYERCEERLWALCETELTEENADLIECYRRWCGDIARYARAVWEETVERYRLSGRKLAQAEMDQRQLRFQLRKNLEVTNT